VRAASGVREDSFSPWPSRGIRDALKGTLLRLLRRLCCLVPVRRESLVRCGPASTFSGNDDHDALEVQRSLIPGAGLGLFATRSFAAGEELCEYDGDLLTSWQQWRTPDLTYVAMAGKDRFVDAGPYPEVKARYINHRFDLEQVNAQYVDAPGHRVFVRAVRPIHPGEEIYADYGPSYWNRVRWNALVINGPSWSRPVRGRHPGGAR
jgi:hypothetical protein